MAMEYMGTERDIMGLDGKIWEVVGYNVIIQDIYIYIYIHIYTYIYILLYYILNYIILKYIILYYIK